MPMALLPQWSQHSDGFGLQRGSNEIFSLEAPTLELAGATRAAQARGVQPLAKGEVTISAVALVEPVALPVLGLVW